MTCGSGALAAINVVTHQATVLKPHQIGLDQLQRLSGSDAPDKEFKRKVKLYMTELQALGALTACRFNITYVPMSVGFMYLVVIMDWFSRSVLAWELSNTLDVGFCLVALDRALVRCQPEFFNSDQGAQFTSQAFTGRIGTINPGWYTMKWLLDLREQPAQQAS